MATMSGSWQPVWHTMQAPASCPFTAWDLSIIATIKGICTVATMVISQNVALELICFDR